VFNNSCRISLMAAAAEPSRRASNMAARSEAIAEPPRPFLGESLHLHGMSYLWNGTRFSTDMFYSSGLRSGDANISHVAPYAQSNAGITHEFLGWNMKPLALRFDV